MAEIRIEKKKPVWPWLLLGVLLIGLLVWMLAGDDNDYDDIEETASVTEVDTYETTTADANVVALPVVDEYIEMVDGAINMDLSHETSHDLISKLANATEAMAMKLNYDTKKDDAFKNMRMYADQITKDPMAGTHADAMKKALENSAMAIQNMQKLMPGVENNSQNLMQEVKDIDPKTLALDQKPEIKEVFREAATALRLLKENMNNM